MSKLSVFLTTDRANNPAKTPPAPVAWAEIFQRKFMIQTKSMDSDILAKHIGSSTRSGSFL